jgi:hypothetical protein
MEILGVTGNIRDVNSGFKFLIHHAVSMNLIQEGTVPVPSRTHPRRIAIVLYYLFRHYRNCAPSPTGGLVAQEGGIRFFPRA